jgi:type VI secretion system secreted protein VgrG
MFPSALPDSSSSALAALLGPWSQAFKQTDRLLRLRTPLGADVLLAETLKGIECISGQAEGVIGFKLQLDALSLNAHLELKQLIAQPVLLQLQTDQSRTELRPLHGHISAVSCVGANGGMARYRLTIEPWLSFLSHGRDSAVFQDQNVLDIVQSVLADYQTGGAYQGAGKLQPAWRLDVFDASVYPKRSLTTQYQESDLAFIERLLLEEGLFYWFEHSGDTTSDNLGAHTLVITDHNGAFKPNARGDVRFSQSQGTITGDTVDRWRPQRSWHTHGVEMASWDYRTLGTRHVAEHASDAPANTPALISQDTPGAYAYENAAQGQRLAANQLQALSVAGQCITAAGSVRAFAPGSTFTLSGHVGDLASQAGEPPRYILLSVIHHARNNLSAELQTAARLLVSGIKSAPSPGMASANSYEIESSLLPANKAQDIFYRNAAQVLPLAIAYRASAQDGQGRQIAPKPNAPGSQTALVIGAPGQQLSTERDHRIKVQFAWQRGQNSQSRLNHPAPGGHSGAPAADAAGATTGTWVRVATALAPMAGANWGAVALPRIGQEVLVTFLDGDIDRPVVVGAVYNGRGQDNSQANQVAQGAANATGNAPMWFPGDQEASGKAGGKLPGHAHNAVLSGIKTQAMSASQSGTAGYNQLVFDDSPGQSRIGLQTHGEPHQGASELNLGQLRQQTDNQRLSPTGYGLELKTQHSGAIRAGAGLLLSADKRGGNDSGSSSAQMDSKEAQAQLDSAQQLLTSLGETAQAHKAMLPVLQTTEAKPDKLPAMAQLKHSIEVIQASASGSGQAGSGEGGGGGAGQAVAYSEPLLVMSAPAGIALLTPQSAMLSAGQTSAISAGQDINLLAQDNAGHTVKGGISLFTYGKAGNASKPNQETGIRLHAASGKVSSQSQSNKTQVTADKAITVASTTDAVSIQAKQHVLLTAQGAYIKLEGGNIEVHAPGMVAFKAEMKNWTGPQSDSNSLTLPKSKLKNCPSSITEAAASQSGAVALS